MRIATAPVPSRTAPAHEVDEASPAPGCPPRRSIGSPSAFPKRIPAAIHPFACRTGHQRARRGRPIPPPLPAAASPTAQSRLSSGRCPTGRCRTDFPIAVSGNFHAYGGNFITLRPYLPVTAERRGNGLHFPASRHPSKEESHGCDPGKDVRVRSRARDHRCDAQYDPRLSEADGTRPKRKRALRQAARAFVVPVVSRPRQAAPPSPATRSSKVCRYGSGAFPRPGAARRGAGSCRAAG